MSRSPIYPPFYFVFANLLMVGIHFALPGSRLWGPPVRDLGWVFWVVGVCVAVYCRLLFARYKTPVRPFQASTELITEGPYLVSRNPIYLAMVVCLIGTAILSGSVLVWLIPAPFAFLIQKYFIEKEEEHLREQFGDEYDTYRARVRRWL